MSHIYIPGGIGSSGDQSNTYEKAMERHIAAFKEDVKNLSEKEGVSSDEAMMYTLQSRVFNLLVNQEKLLYSLKKRRVL